jgi:hypothetical protein
MHHKFFRNSLFIFLTFLFFSCQEEVELTEYSAQPVLVVDGEITNEYRPQQIRLSQSADYRAEKPFPAATGAFVSLSDGMQTLDLVEVEPGLYQTDSLAGQPGKIYTLQINWEGQNYTASDTMPALPGVFDPVSFNAEGKDGTFEYRRHQFGFPEANKWELIVAVKDTTDFPDYDIDRLGQQVGIEVKPPADYYFTYFTHPNIEVNGLMNFEEGHFYGYVNPRIVTQKRYALSASHYQFLRALFMETEWRGTLFDSTPANVKGNVSNGALGFFSACSVRSIQFEI